MIYSDNTHVCASAYHAGVISKDNEIFFLIIENGLECYYSAKSNMINS
jgi:hypothetical protein